MKESHKDQLITVLDILKNELGIENQEVAQKIGISKHKLSRLRSGGTKVQPYIITSIKEAFPELMKFYEKKRPTGDKIVVDNKYTAALEEIVRLERENKELLIEAMELKKAMELNGEKVSQEVLKLIKELEEIQDKKASIDFDFIQEEIKRIIKRKN